MLHRKSALRLPRNVATPERARSPGSWVHSSNAPIEYVDSRGNNRRTLVPEHVAVNRKKTGACDVPAILPGRPERHAVSPRSIGLTQATPTRMPAPRRDGVPAGNRSPYRCAASRFSRDAGRAWLGLFTALGKSSYSGRRERRRAVYPVHVSGSQALSRNSL